MDTKTITKLKVFKRKVQQDYPLEKMILFGSRSRRRYKKFSDVDLILVSKKFSNLSFVERGSMMYKYWDLDLPVDFICYSTEEFKEKSNQLGILSQAVKEGIEI